MTPSLSAAEHATLLRKLAYARWLFQRGEQEQSRPDELSHMMAIMLFHNANEMVIQNIVLSYGYARAAQLKNLKFEALLDFIDNKGGGSAAPPLLADRGLVSRLAEQRNTVMHQGQQVHKKVVEEARNTTLRFLRRAIHDFFELDYDTLSLVDIVQSSTVREWLQAAEQCQAQDEFLNSVIYSAAVVAITERAVNHAYSSSSDDNWHREFRGNFVKSSMRSHVSSRSLRLDQQFRSIQGEIQSLVSNTAKDIHKSLEPLIEAVEDMQKRLEKLVEARTDSGWLVICGANLELSRQFYDLGISVELGDLRHLGVRKSGNQLIDKEAAEVAREFALDTSLKVQSLGLSDLMVTELPPKYRRFQREESPQLPSLLAKLRNEAAEDYKREIEAHRPKVMPKDPS